MVAAVLVRTVEESLTTTPNHRNNLPDSRASVQTYETPELQRISTILQSFSANLPYSRASVRDALAPEDTCHLLLSLSVSLVQILSLLLFV